MSSMMLALAPLLALKLALALEVCKRSVLELSSMRFALTPKMALGIKAPEGRKRLVLVLKLALALAPEVCKRPVLLLSSKRLALASLSGTKAPEDCKRPVWLF